MTTPKTVEIELKNKIKDDPITIQQEVLEEKKDSTDKTKNDDEYIDEEEIDDDDDEYNSEDFNESDKSDEDNEDDDEDDEVIEWKPPKIKGATVTLFEGNDVNQSKENVSYTPQSIDESNVDQVSDDEVEEEMIETIEKKNTNHDGFSEMYKANLEKAQNEVTPDLTTLFLLLGGIILYKKLKK